MKIEHVRLFPRHCRMVLDGVVRGDTRSDIIRFCFIQHVGRCIKCLKEVCNSSTLSIH